VAIGAHWVGGAGPFCDSRAPIPHGSWGSRDDDRSGRCVCLDAGGGIGGDRPTGLSGVHVGAGARADVEESVGERVTVRDIADREQRGIPHADRLGELLARVGGCPAEGLVEAGVVAGCPDGVGVERHMLRGQWRELPDPGLAVAPAFYRGRERVVDLRGKRGGNGHRGTAHSACSKSKLSSCRSWSDAGGFRCWSGGFRCWSGGFRCW
jgi:hypothetical protein